VIFKRYSFNFFELKTFSKGNLYWRCSTG